MKKIFEYLKKDGWFKGDKILWIAVIMISLFSLFPVYSASANLEYVVREGTTAGHLVKHALFIVIGLGIMRGIGIFRYEYIGYFSIFFLGAVIVLLILTLFMGSTIGGASAARWIKLGPFSFQPSTFAYLLLIIHICWYLTRKTFREHSVVQNIIWLFLPILIVFGLVFKDNGSTGLIIFGVSMIVMLIGQYPIKQLAIFGGIMTVLVGVFLFLALTTNIFEETRVHTWKSRVEVFLGIKELNEEERREKDYQVDRAKAAIVHGSFKGVGPGKSALVSSLPQSASDFIFAIIIEEYGFLGGFALIGVYFIILVRIIMIARNIPYFFGKLLSISIGVMIFVQLAINIAVALSMIPVTGQPLPLISYGGTSMLVTYMQLGIVLNISSRIQVLYDEVQEKKQFVQGISDIA